jgi:hypothetical protein
MWGNVHRWADLPALAQFARSTCPRAGSGLSGSTLGSVEVLGANRPALSIGKEKKITEMGVDAVVGLLGVKGDGRQQRGVKAEHFHIQVFRTNDPKDMPYFFFQ